MYKFEFPYYKTGVDVHTRLDEIISTGKLHTDWTSHQLFPKI